MTEVSTASSAMDRLTRHPKGLVLGGAYRVLKWRPKAWPAGPAVEFGLRGKQGQVTAGTRKDPWAVLVIEGTGKRSFSSFLSQHRVPLRGQQSPPLSIRMGDFEFRRPRNGHKLHVRGTDKRQATGRPKSKVSPREHHQSS